MTIFILRRSEVQIHFCNLPELVIRELRLGAELWWIRDGEKRIIPRILYETIQRKLRLYRLAVRCNRIGANTLSPDIDLIAWQQTEPLAEVYLAGDPTPSGGTGDADGSSVD